jgi:hypothetical protein
MPAQQVALMQAKGHIALPILRHPVKVTYYWLFGSDHVVKSPIAVCLCYPAPVFLAEMDGGDRVFHGAMRNPTVREAHFAASYSH